MSNISYSTYVCQYLAMGGVLLVFRSLVLLTFGLVYDRLFHIACQCLVGRLAYGPYQYFETQFLELKNKYALVKSTTDATASPRATLS